MPGKTGLGKKTLRKIVLAVTVLAAVAYGLSSYPGIDWRDVLVVLLASTIFVVVLAVAGLFVAWLLQFLRRSKRDIE